MIQRIQTVYLFLVFLFAILYVVLPLAHFPAVMPDMPLRVIQYNEFMIATGITGSWMGALLIVLFALAALVTVYTTFLFRRRITQIRLGKYNMIIHAAIIMTSFFFVDNIKKQVSDAGFSYGAGIVFPVISLLLILLANRSIRKDEELVRSADRIR